MKQIVAFTALAAALSLNACTTSNGCQSIDQVLISKYGSSNFLPLITQGQRIGANDLTKGAALIESAMGQPNLTPYAISYGYRELGHTYLLNKSFEKGISALEKALETGGFTGVEGDGLPSYIRSIREIAHNQKEPLPETSEAKPLVRIPAPFPSQSSRSGHCQMQFSVNSDGNIYDAEALYCTQEVFRAPSLAALSRWKYSPKTVNGIAVNQTGVTNKIVYKLSDQCGNIIPE